MTANTNRRFHVRFGNHASEPALHIVPQNHRDLLDRAMALLDELRDADFMPEEFHAEFRALRTAWNR